MSRSQSPLPRFISTTPVPQQVIDQSGELPQSSFSTLGSFPSQQASSFPTNTSQQVLSFPSQLPGSFNNAQAMTMMPPPTMSPLSAQVSFDEDPFLPGSGQSLATSQPTVGSPSFGAPQIAQMASQPQMIPMQPSTEGRTIRVALPAPADDGLHNIGVAPQTLPPVDVAQMHPPTSLPMFPLIGAAPTTTVMTTSPQLEYVSSPVSDPFQDPFFAAAFPTQPASPVVVVEGPAVTRTVVDTRRGPPIPEPVKPAYIPSRAAESISYAGNVVGGVAYDAGSVVADVAKEGIQEIQGGSMSALFLIIGFFGTLLLVLIPVWDGFSLLDDPVWVHMAGETLPKVLIGCALSIPALFVITAVLLVKCGHRSAGANTEQTMLTAGVLFILLLGGMLVTISSPISEKATMAKGQLVGSCQTGSLTRPLYLEYGVLQKLRNTSACASKASVEDCAGFTATPASATLKDFEQYMHCSGFCYFPIVNQTTNAPSATADFYPPALFSPSSLQGSCSAMAARNMESFVIDISQQLMFEGFFLIGASILQGFAIVFGLVYARGSSLSKKAGYGTIQYKEPVDAVLEQSADIRRRQKMMEF